MNASKTKAQIIRSHTITYFNILNLILAGLIVFSGQYKNMLFMGIVISNSLIGIVQELKVKKLIDALAVITATKARLVTDNGVRQVPIEELAVQDRIQVSAGDQIPADCRVCTSEGLEVNESLLTGESLPILKQPGDPLYSGSFITAANVVSDIRCWMENQNSLPLSSSLLARISPPIFSIRRWEAYNPLPSSPFFLIFP